MHNQVISPRCFALFGVLLIVLLLAFACKAGADESTPIVGAVPPLSAVAVVACNSYVSVFITYADGRFYTVDAKHHAGFDQTSALTALIASATHQKILEMDCTAVGHDSVAE